MKLIKSLLWVPMAFGIAICGLAIAKLLASGFGIEFAGLPATVMTAYGQFADALAYIVVEKWLDVHVPDWLRDLAIIWLVFASSNARALIVMSTDNRIAVANYLSRDWTFYTSAVSMGDMRVNSVGMLAILVFWATILGPVASGMGIFGLLRDGGSFSNPSLSEVSLRQPSFFWRKEGSCHVGVDGGLEPGCRVSSSLVEFRRNSPPDSRCGIVA